MLAINELGLSQFGLSNSMTSVLVVAELVGIAIGGLLSVYLAKKIKWYRLLAPAAAVMAVCMVAVGSSAVLCSIHKIGLPSCRACRFGNCGRRVCDTA